MLLKKEQTGKKRLKKRQGRIANLRIGLIAMMICLMVPCMKLHAGAAAVMSTEYYGGNISSPYFEGKGYYKNYASPVISYLTYDGAQLMRVQSGVWGLEGILVEYYNLKFERQSTKLIPEELPLFGGFYVMGDYYYLVTGQENPSESADVEVFRITKYDKEWKRIGSVGLYDCNTTVPFDFGSLRMDSSGKYLIIRTCHEMYKSQDGHNHQANVTIQVDTEQMKITDSHTSVSWLGAGYVSHSFNQFVKLEDNHIIAVDHGDAYPRSIVLTVSPTDISTGSFSSTSCKSVPVMSFPGSIGNNTTGAAVGGMEISGSSYLVAGNSVIQDERNISRETRNVFLAVIQKDTDEVTMKWLTDYAEGEKGVGITQLVKISEDLFMLLWEDKGEVCYVNIDGEGNIVSDIKKMDGYLSDCAPIVVNGKVIWYTWNAYTLEFYRVNTSDKYEGDVNTELKAFSYDEETHYLSGEIVVVEWVDVDGDGIKESTVPEYAPKMEFVAADGSESIEVFVTPTGTNTYYFDRLIADGLTYGKEYMFHVTSGDANNVSASRTVPVYTGTSGIGESGILGKAANQEIRFKTASSGALLLYGINSNEPYIGDVNSLLQDVDCTVSGLGNFVSGHIVITEWIDGISTVPRTTPIMTFDSYDGTETNEVFMKCMDGTNTYYFDRNLNEGLTSGKEYVFRITLTETNNVSERKSMVATTNEMEAKEVILWETDTQTVMYKTVPADGDNQLRVYAISK